MLTLGIETSSAGGSVALVRAGTLLGEHDLDPAGRRHARSLVAEIGRQLEAAGARPADCDAVAVSIGPGSFTGLRVGVVAAKTFAYATGCRLAAIDTFLAIAGNSPPDVDLVWVTANAQRGDLFVAPYRRGSDRRFARTGDVSIQTIDAFCEDRSAGEVVSGPGADLIAARLAGRARVLPPDCRRPRAALVAQLGERAVRAGDVADLWSLEPLYVRKSAAEEKWDSTRS
jgi:tRNA threonylcarbamoyladenosine biosynthesis protein TsaB